MLVSDRKELFSSAYLHAVAAVSGYDTYKMQLDRDGVDWGVAARGGNGTLRSPRFELQLKCVSPDTLGQTEISYPLKQKNYNDLI